MVTFVLEKKCTIVRINFNYLMSIYCVSQLNCCMLCKQSTVYVNLVENKEQPEISWTKH